MPFDASALRGFAFELSGPTIPVSMRFVVENANGQYCTPAAKPLLAGQNSVLFSDLLSECWAPGLGSPPDVSGIVKIAWHVVTNSASEVPFDYCVSNIVALPN